MIEPIYSFPGDFKPVLSEKCTARRTLFGTAKTNPIRWPIISQSVNYSSFYGYCVRIANTFNLAYEVLSWKVHRALIKAKLEPYLGFLYSVQFGNAR